MNPRRAWLLGLPVVVVASILFVTAIGMGPSYDAFG